MCEIFFINFFLEIFYFKIIIYKHITINSNFYKKINKIEFLNIIRLLFTNNKYA